MGFPLEVDIREEKRLRKRKRKKKRKQIFSSSFLLLPNSHEESKPVEIVVK